MIKNQARFLTEIDIPAAEARFNAKFVMESPLRQSGGWRDEPSLIFWSETAHPQGSNYFALSRTANGYCISNAIDAVSETIAAVRADNGDVIFSSCRHDFQTSEDGSVSIDGGRDYTRVISDPDHHAERSVELEVVDGVLQERTDDHITKP